ncbi:MAG: twin arginine-targeting protein translocase TatB [Gammaproteobacteria bacterium RBG_16_57_12]|nr:MAG: twin arginine-targeting protein translocase TatB [Gammaproteobacteria bacterium RBG_16_57_12]
MFDIGFLELVLIGVVALVVFGPQRLPEVVRTAGFWVGKLRAAMSNVRSEVKREMHNAEVLQRELEEKIKKDVALPPAVEKPAADQPPGSSDKTHADKPL